MTPQQALDKLVVAVEAVGAYEYVPDSRAQLCYCGCKSDSWDASFDGHRRVCEDLREAVKAAKVALHD